MSVAVEIERKPVLSREAAPEKEWSEGDLSGASFSAGKALKTTGSAVVDWGGRLAEGVDALIDIPRKALGLLSYVPLPFSKEVGWALGTIASGICSFAVHTPTFGVFKWLKYLRRGSAVSGAVNEGVAPDGNLDSVTVKSFLSTISDEKLRNDLKEYFVLSKALGVVAADKALTEEDREEKTGAINGNLAKLELMLSRRAEFNELKQLAGLGQEHQLASEAQLTQLAENMAEKMIKMVEGRYKDRLGFLGGGVTGDWANLAAKGEEGRPLLVKRIKERLLSAYLAERNHESAQEQVEDIKNELATAFKTSSTLREAMLYTVLPLVLYGPTALNIDIGQTLSDWGQAAKEWLGNIAPNLVPQWVRDAVEFAGQAAKTAWDAIWVIGGGWVVLKAAEIGKGIFGSGGETHPVDGSTHVDPSVRADSNLHGDGTSLHPDGSNLRPTEGHTGDATRPTDGSSLLDTVRSQADRTAADTSGRAEASRVDTTGPVRSQIDTGSVRGVDPAHVARPHADVRVETSGRVQDPTVRAETIRVNPHR